MITQKYVKFETIKCSNFLTVRDIALKVPTAKIDPKRQRNGLMPNIIHSFDAANIVKTVDILKNAGVEIFTIHDCFASVACDAYTVQQAVKAGFIKLYINRDFLHNFNEGCLRGLEQHDPSVITVDRSTGKVFHADAGELNLPEIPTLGSLDISMIIESKYMVC